MDVKIQSEKVLMAMNSDSKSMAEGELYIADTGGEIATNARNTDLHRGFKSRHIGMFAIAGSIGTGLLIASGGALSRGGPGSILIAYSVVGLMVLNVMSALGEMTVYMPMQKGFSGYAARLVDPALGFATGANFFLKYTVLLCNNLTAAGIVMQYWLPNVNVGVWVISFAIPIICINLLPVKYFGELEFWVALLKTATILGLILLCVIISAGGTSQGVIGFKYWNDPGAFKPYLVAGTTGQFLGFWYSLTNAGFAFMGTEMVGIAFGETAKPWKAIPKALSVTFLRIAFFYVGGVFVLGLCVSSSSAGLISATSAKTGANASPFVVAINNVGIPVLPGLINGAILICILSAAYTDLYLASRTLYGLAKDGYMPKFLTKTYNSLPYPAIGVSASFFVIAFMNASTTSVAVFGYLVSMATVFGLLNWVNILVCYLSFRRGLRAQNIDKDVLPYKARFLEGRVIVTLFLTSLIIFFNGFASFVGNFNHTTFITSYIGLVIYLLLIFGWKFGAKSMFVGFKTMDLSTDVITKANAIDLEAEEEVKPSSSILKWAKNLKI